MSNRETDPAVVVCEGGAREGAVMPFREVPLGGPRAMTVRRTLPQRGRSLIGGWCFVDHYGPDDVAATGGMALPGHPHTGLQTVSWLFDGELEHLDTTGARETVRPGQVNLMTAGSGIAHSEYSTPATRALHGAQLWIALPKGSRFVDPGFEHYEPPVVDVDGARVQVFLGALAGQASPVTTYSPLVGAEVVLGPGGSIPFDVEPGFEHGLLCDGGAVTVGAATAHPGELLYLPPGAARLDLRGSATSATRLLLLGGEPLGERLVMWWNFIGRSHDEVVEYREDWERWRAERGGGRYGAFPAEWRDTIPAPPMPNLRLRSRG